MQQLINKPSKETSQKDIEKILMPLTSAQVETLGFTLEDLSRFAVYKYDEKENKLKIHFETINNQANSNHKFPITDECASISFIKELTIISPNTAKLTEGLNLEKSISSWEASMMATPIFGVDGPVGVFTITSSRVDHFTAEFKIYLESV